MTVRPQQRLIVAGQSQGGGKQPGEHPPTSVPGNTQAENASAPAGSSSQEAQTRYIRTKTSDKRLIKSELTLAHENTEAGFIQETSLGFPLRLWPHGRARGMLRNSGLGVVPLRELRGSRVCGALGGSGPARARPRSQRRWGGCAENTERAEGQRRCQKWRGGRGGRTGKGRAAMLSILFIVLLAQVTRKENKEPQSKGCNTREGRKYFCLPTSPGVSALGFPCQRRCARWRETSPPAVEGRASVPECPTRASPCHGAESE